MGEKHSLSYKPRIPGPERGEIKYASPGLFIRRRIRADRDPGMLRGATAMTARLDGAYIIAYLPLKAQVRPSASPPFLRKGRVNFLPALFFAGRMKRILPIRSLIKREEAIGFREKNFAIL